MECSPVQGQEAEGRYIGIDMPDNLSPESDGSRRPGLEPSPCSDNRSYSGSPVGRFHLRGYMGPGCKIQSLTRGRGGGPVSDDPDMG